MQLSELDSPQSSEPKKPPLRWARALETVLVFLSPDSPLARLSALFSGSVPAKAPWCYLAWLPMEQMMLVSSVEALPQGLPTGPKKCASLAAVSMAHRIAQASSWPPFHGSQ